MKSHVIIILFVIENPTGFHQDSESSRILTKIKNKIPNQNKVLKCEWFFGAGVMDCDLKEYFMIKCRFAFVTDALCNFSVKDRFLGCPSDSRLGPSRSVLFPQIEVDFQQREVYWEIIIN